MRQSRTFNPEIMRNLPRGQSKKRHHRDEAETKRSATPSEDQNRTRPRTSHARSEQDCPVDRLLPRFAWDGQQRDLAVWWTLRRGSGPQRAVCRMLTHPFGHELRLEVRRKLVASEACGSDETVLSTQEAWRSALEAKGWVK